MKLLLLILVLSLPIFAYATETNETKRYVVTLEVRETHFTLSISQHIKDAANASTFEIPVDKAFYDSVKVGDILNDKFRTGSLILSGSFGNWKVSIKEKKVVN